MRKLLVKEYVTTWSPIMIVGAQDAVLLKLEKGLDNSVLIAFGVKENAYTICVASFWMLYDFRVGCQTWTG